MTTSTATGNKAGAIALIQSFLSGGKVPGSWLKGSADTPTEMPLPGGYTLTIFPPTLGSTGGIGQISWGNHTSAADSYQFTFNNSGQIIGDLAKQTQPDQGQVIPQTIGDNLKNAPGDALAGAKAGAQSVANTVKDAASGITSLSDGVVKLLGAITSSAFWKRVGIGVGGAALLVIGIVIMLRHDIPSPASVAKAAIK